MSGRAKPPEMGQSNATPPQSARPVRVVNTEGSDAPPFAVLEVIGWDSELNAFEVRKCTVSGRTDVIFNGHTPIGAGLEGQAWVSNPITAAYSPSEGADPVPGQHMGTKDGEWFLSPNYPGFVVREVASGELSIAIVDTVIGRRIEVVNVTSATAGSGTTLFPADIKVLNPVTDTWDTEYDAVWFRDVNGSTTVATGYKLAAHVGYTAGRYVFAGVESGGSSTPTVTSWKHVVRAKATSNVTVSSPGSSFDGVTFSSGDTADNKRLLLADQSSASENGVYQWNGAASALTRTADADGTDELVGATVWVSEGTQNGNTIWACTTDKTITPGSTSTVWVKVYPLDYFPAQLTSTYSSGYSWKRRTITSGTWADASAPLYPLTGTNNAYTSDDNQTLQSGQDGFVYRDATGTKWVFIPLILEHFPARLTSTYSSGYSWKRRTVTSGSWADHSSSQTGTNNAFTPSGNTGLASGTDGYIFRDGAKWVFLPDTVVSLAYDSGGPYDDYTVSGSASATNILVVGTDQPLVIPGHGDYLITWNCKIHFAMPDPSASGSGNTQAFSLKWRNDTDGVNYTDYFAASSELTNDILSPPGDTIWDFCVSRTDIISVSAGSDSAKDFLLMATSSGSGGSGTISEVRVTVVKLS